MKVRGLALTSVFAALYAVLVIALASISFQLVQVRVADALIPLSMVFGWPVVAGVTIGCVVGNVVSPMPSIITDITFGAIANFIASLLAWKIGGWKHDETKAGEFLGCSAATIAITCIVGTYLAFITEMELWIWWLGIGIGSMISISILGYILLQITKKVVMKSNIA
ncbi:MAG: QueT transporter [Candidatus Bathyarchaeota archaeon BA1]|nr:MAG: QueT transporter [Candidatus Bathyarchaeota archaeon BA1]